MMMNAGIEKSTGLSVIEVLISVVIGTILLSGVATVAINSTDSYRVQNAQQRMQENGQFSMIYLAKDIRNIDYWGCANSSALITNLLNGAGNLYYNYTLTGAPGSVSGTSNASGSGTQVAGTDSITIRGVSTVGSGARVQAPYGPTSTSNLNVPAGTSITNGSILLVSDCQAGDIFQVTSVAGTSIGHAASGSPGNLSASLSKVYDGTAAVYFPFTRTYDVRNGTGGLPSLFITDINGSRELVQGIQGLVILYGEDTDSDGIANRYVRAASVGNMDNVVSIRLMVLVETLEDNLIPAPQAYTFNGVTTTPTDRRLRRTFTSTIVIRNRSE